MSGGIWQRYYDGDWLTMDEFDLIEPKHDFQVFHSPECDWPLVGSYDKLTMMLDPGGSVSGPYEISTVPFVSREIPQVDEYGVKIASKFTQKPDNYFVVTHVRRLFSLDAVPR